MESYLIHVCVLGLLLFIGVVLRAKLKIFKRFFVPASLIAGVLGLTLGQYGLEVIPVSMSETFALLPQVLITIVFAPMLMGITFPKPKQVADRIGPQLVFGYAGDFILIGLPCLVTALLIAPIWGVNEMFGTLAEVGFVGGHGTAAGMASIFEQQGWEAGGPLGMTMATIGLFVGIVGGMVIVNYGVRRGHTSFVSATGDGPAADASDLIPREEQPIAGRATINTEVVEPLAFHFSIVALAVLVGVMVHLLLERATGLTLPLFPLAMIGGLIVQFSLSRTSFSHAIDKNTLLLLQGLALELLIVAAVATIEVPVVVDFAVPILLLSSVAILGLVAYFFFVGPRVFKDDWFEQSIVNYGALAGVTAVGLMLLRTVDPHMSSRAGQAFALRAPFFSPIAGGGLLTSVLPVLAVSYGALAMGAGFLAAALLLFVLARWLGYWHNARKPR